MRRIALSALAAAATVLGCSAAALAGTDRPLHRRGHRRGPAPPPPGYLDDSFGCGNQVSCASATSCFAVGERLNSRGTDLPAAESWHAGTWKAVSAAKVPGYAGETSELLHVSCKAANYCLALRRVPTWATGPPQYAMTWNGTTLTPVAKLPLPSGDSIAELGTVYCTAVESCDVFASGNDRIGSQRPPGRRRVRLDVERRQVVGDRHRRCPDGDLPVINSARCFSATSCVLAGATIPQAGSASTMAPLLASWNGKTLTAMNPVVPAGMKQAEFKSVSCAAATSCAAAGAVINGANTSAFLDVTTGSGWNLTKWGGPSGMTSTLLTGVSCVSRSTASPRAGSPPPRAPLAAALTWNGTKWTVIKVPGPGTGNGSIFFGVSCPAAGNCTAIGETGKAADESQQPVCRTLEWGRMET